MEIRVVATHVMAHSFQVEAQSAGDEYGNLLHHAALTCAPAL
jgi:hypothetical protein